MDECIGNEQGVIYAIAIENVWYLMKQVMIGWIFAESESFRPG